jgi:nucleotide-binding universal stress UspA family protein
MIQTILVPTDGSSHADKAVSLAGNLAQLYGARVVLLHAVPDIINEGVPAGYRELAEAQHLEIGDVLISVGDEIIKRAEAQLRAKGVKTVTSTLPSGSAAQAILNYANDHPIDMIVMGSRGLSNLKGLMLGSVSHKVSHLASCSCLTVR